MRIDALAWDLAGETRRGRSTGQGRAAGKARHRAEQIVLNEMILLPPEPGAGESSAATAE